MQNNMPIMAQSITFTSFTGPELLQSLNLIAIYWGVLQDLLMACFFLNDVRSLFQSAGFASGDSGICMLHRGLQQKLKHYICIAGKLAQ